MQATPICDRREKRAPTVAQPSPVIHTVERHDEGRYPADPDGRAKLMQKRRHDQNAAIVEPCYRMRGEGRRGELDEAEQKEQEARRILAWSFLPHAEQHGEPGSGSDLDEACERGTRAKRTKDRKLDRADEDCGLKRNRQRLADDQRQARVKRDPTRVFDDALPRPCESGCRGPREIDEKNDAAHRQRLRNNRQPVNNDAEVAKKLDEQRQGLLSCLIADGEWQIAPRDMAIDGQHLPAQRVAAGRQRHGC